MAPTSQSQYIVPVGSLKWLIDFGPIGLALESNSPVLAVLLFQCGMRKIYSQVTELKNLTLIFLLLRKW